MQNFKWLFIIGGMLAGVFTPWQIQVPIMVALLMAYMACYSLKWSSFQIVLESLFGGLATGLGLQLLIGFGLNHRFIEMLIVPLLTWLLLRIIFYGVETKYTLHPNAVLTQMRAEDTAAPYFDDSLDKRSQTGVSAWSGDNTGSAAEPDANGQYMRYEFYARSEIAMGGPIYGEAIFSNGCAFDGVGPSIALSEDGRYAVMTQPSREQWGLLLADLQEKLTYSPDNIGFWEFDRIENGVIYGRHSPITHNTALHLSIEEAIASTKAQPMLQDDGWWVPYYLGREPFAQYKAVTISSKQGQHKVTFVPDLKPFKNNPFLRSSNPSYSVLVDDALLEFKFDVTRPEALWVDGLAKDKARDGRFLVLPTQIIDFKDAATGEFSVQPRTTLMFSKGFDESTNLDFEYGQKSDAGEGYLLAQGYILPRSTGWDDAEYMLTGDTSPWDDEDVTYWDAAGQNHVQTRTHIKRYVEYKIDLNKFSQTKQLKNAVLIQLVNRGNPKHQASLAYQNETNYEGGYSSYQLTTSCGITLPSVTSEAIWSHCGRYLAVLQFERPPNLPHKISIIDFKTAKVKEIAGHYALPSFIWFDENMLQLTHLVGIQESLTHGAKHQQEVNTMRISQPEYAAEPYRLLIGDIGARRTELKKQAKTKQTTPALYSEGSVTIIAQHCILFAPKFSTPVLQPPAGNQANSLKPYA
jgi:hypothetical protein